MFSQILQLIIALGIYNVWILRFGQSTSWRGGEAQNMTEEFAAYGLPYSFMLLIGGLKLTFATLLLYGVVAPFVVFYAALGIAVLMAGAVSMHIKVKDPLKKSLPAFTMLTLSLIVTYLNF